MSKITKIEFQKRNKDRVNVFIDEEFAFPCDGELIFKFNLNKSQEVDIEKLTEIINEDNFKKCKTSALRIVERSYKTEKEIRDKLFIKGYDAKSVDRTINFLKEYSFLNDDSYVDMYVKDRIRNQGKNKIKYNLLRKGVSEEVIQDKINNIDSSLEKETAYNLCLKKYNQLIKRENDNYKLYQKLYRFLASKGYDCSCVNETVKKVMKINDFME